MHWMYQNDGPYMMEFFGMNMIPFAGFLPLLIWSLAWKGWALWLAARRGELVWFIALLFINTAGLLEIFYIFVVAKRSDTREIEEKNIELARSDHQEKTTH